MKLLLDRSAYEDHETLGDLYVDAIWECLTLEPALQPNDIKIPGQTCIPPGIYQVLLTWSPKFKRILPLIVNVPGFDGIRFHPGNTYEDTAGCVETGESLVPGVIPALLNSATAFNRLFTKLDAAIRRGESIEIEIQP